MDLVMAWFKIETQKIQLKIFVKPNARQTKIVKIAEDELHIALHAKPQEGEANKALIEFLAEWLNIPKSQITLQHGNTSRHKTMVIPSSASVKKMIEEQK